MVFLSAAWIAAGTNFPRIGRDGEIAFANRARRDHVF
jgi:hypothetical protein